MRDVTLSVRGLHNYDNTIFDTMMVPSRVDKESIVYTILTEFANMEVMYPNPDIFKEYLAYWSRIRLPVWEQLCDTLEYEYNPIHNYDRTEEWTDTHNYTLDKTEGVTMHDSHSDNNTNSLTRDADGGSKQTTDRDLTDDHTTVDTGNESSNTLNSVTAYNTGNMVTHDKAETTSNHSNNTKLTGTNNEDTTVDYDWDESETSKTTSVMTGVADAQHDSVGKDVHDGEDTHKAHLYGNIGVTTTQEMIQAQRDIVQFTVEEHIVQEFKDKFVLGVYLF